MRFWLACSSVFSELAPPTWFFLRPIPIPTHCATTEKQLWLWLNGLDQFRQCVCRRDTFSDSLRPLHGSFAVCNPATARVLRHFTTLFTCDVTSRFIHEFWLIEILQIFVSRWAGTRVVHRNLKFWDRCRKHLLGHRPLTWWDHPLRSFSNIHHNW